MINWILEIPEFYLRPIKLAQKFFNKSDRIKLLQTSFYSLILILLVSLFSEKSLTELASELIQELIASAIVLLVLMLTNFFTGLIFKTKVSSATIVYYIILIKLFTLPIFLTFNYIFIKTEKYELAFLQNAVLGLLTLTVYFHSPKIFYQKSKIIIFSIISNVIIGNLFVFSYHLLHFDKDYLNTQKIENDDIYEEYESKILPYLDTTIDKVPILKMDPKFKNDTSKALSLIFESNDTANLVKHLSGIIDTDIRYVKAAKSELSYFYKLTSELEFERNKLIVVARIEHIKTVLKALSKASVEGINPIQSSDCECPQIFQYKLYPVESDVFKTYYVFSDILSNQINSTEIAMYPTHIVSFLFYPGNLAGSFFY